MTRLINANETVDAKSETRMVEACETCNCEQCTCDQSTEQEEVNMLPFFDSPAYLDKLVSTDPNTNKQAIAYLEEYLHNHASRIANRLAMFDVSQLNDYVNDIKKVLDQLQKDEKQSVKCLEKIEEKIEELEGKYNCLETSCDAIDILKDFYEELLSKTTYILDNSIRDLSTNKEEKLEYRGCNCQDDKCQSGSCAPGNEKLNEELRNLYKSDMKDFWNELLKILH
jgi:archaellum component FlaC